MRETVTIAPRFRGPPNSGHGGYVSGVLAEHLDGPAEVTLCRPVPLARPLVIERDNGGAIRLCDGADLVAECRRGELDLEVPEPPAFAAAVRAAELAGGADDDTFGGCFVCGPNRPPGDGMRIFAAPLDGRAMVAAPWVPAKDLADETGAIAPRYLWAALDCPGAVAIQDDWPDLPVTGRMLGEVVHRIGAGERCLVIGWPVADRGRKRYSGTAVFSEAGRLAARALTTWIVPRRERVPPS